MSTQPVVHKAEPRYTGSPICGTPRRYLGYAPVPHNMDKFWAKVTCKRCLKLRPDAGKEKR